MCGVLSPLFIAYVCSYIFIYYIFFFFFFFKQKTAYEMRISDWSSDVCSSDLLRTRTTSQATLQASSPPPWNCLRQLLPTSFPDQDLQARRQDRRRPTRRSEEHTSELQSLMRISYAVFCLKKKKKKQTRKYQLSKTTSNNVKDVEIRERKQNAIKE